MALSDIAAWVSEFSKPGLIWFAKRLAANDTLATDAHQAGPYIPKELLFEIFPNLNRPTEANPDVWFDLYVDSHSDHRKVRAVWYNNKIRGTVTRNETRLTNFGGSQSALLDPDSTGAVAAFVFVTDTAPKSPECHVWVCSHVTEEDVLEDLLGPIEPKAHVVWEPGALRTPNLLVTPTRMRDTCRLSEDEIPAHWLQKFPSGEDIVRKTLEMRPLNAVAPDVRLIKRRVCEYEIFQSIEKAVYTPHIREGFQSIDKFVALAHTILQSRRSRSGNSLELHTREILIEEGFQPDEDFVYRPIIERNKRPDFIFPSTAAYEDKNFPDDRLRMLAAKTTCKERWRQVLKEANRITVKHLLTLQEGVSEGQFREMTEAGLVLVVPTGLHKSYPKSVQPHLISLETFITDVRLLKYD